LNTSQNKFYLRVQKISPRAFLVVKVWFIVFFLGFFSCIQSVRAADPTSVSVNPSIQTVNASSTFVVTVECLPQQPVKAFELKLSFNPSRVRATSVTEGDFFEGYTTFFNPGEIDNSAGKIINVYDLIVGPGNVSGAGSLVMINFTAKTTSGTSALSLYEVRLTNESDYIDIDVASGSVQVTGGSSPPSPPPSEPPSNPPADENNPPGAPLKPVGPTLVEAGTVYLYNSSAVDPDGDSVRLRFDWGDGSLSAWSNLIASNTSVSASHAWVNVSNYAIRVIAQDASGSNSSWSETLTVMISQIESEGFPPVGSFHIPGNASVNHSMVFDASGSYDPDGTIVSYVWDFGDGITGVGQVLVHTYESPGEYTVTLTVTDNAGMNYSSSQVVRITDSSQASTGAGAGFLRPNDLMILLVVATITGLMLLFVYRYRTREVSLQKHIDASKQRLALMDQGTADIDAIVDALFSEVQHRKQTPRADTLLDAYNALIIGRVEKNPAIAVPNLSIDKVESLVDRRIHAMIVEKIEKL
jgi:chitodextrinase